MLAVTMVWPIWAFPYIPFQDLPQHLAIASIVHAHGHDASPLWDMYEVALFRSPYVIYYAFVDLLSYLVPVEVANRAFITVVMVSWPYAMRSLLRAVGAAESYALLVFPLTYNAHWILGFFNYVAAIPLALWGLALIAKQSRSWCAKRAWLIGAVALLTFYAHVVPFGMLSLGAVFLTASRRWQLWVKQLVPLIPAGLAGLVWLFRSASGRATLGAAMQVDTQAARATFTGPARAWREMHAWLTDVFHTPVDDGILIAWVVLVVVAAVIGLARPQIADRRRVAVGVLAPIAFIAYFVLPTGYQWLWAIAQRFLILACLFVLVALPRLSRWPTTLIAVVAIGLSLAQVTVAGQSFEGFQGEISGLDEAIEAIPSDKKVAGLIWDRGSRHVKYSPLLHSVAYYQQRKGGVVMFTFALNDQSPVRFRQGQGPPEVKALWEWFPNHVRPAQELVWYDYVLSRRMPRRVAARMRPFSPVFVSESWTVWQRTR